MPASTHFHFLKKSTSEKKSVSCESRLTGKKTWASGESWKSAVAHKEPECPEFKVKERTYVAG